MDRTDPRYRAISEYYDHAVEGHVYIRETLDLFFRVLGNRAQALNHPPRILELGSHAGVISESLLELWPGSSLIVNDDDETLVAMSRARLDSPDVVYNTGPLNTVTQSVDFITSIARHHHLPHGYLNDVRRIMTPTTVYVLADELCPEYCVGEHRARVEQAELISVVGGFVLTTFNELRAFETTGAIPEAAVALEQLRRRALWQWYRFVVDEAVARGYFDIAIGELQSTHDDLITGSDAEHKFSPLIVERQFALAGFQRLSKRLIGPVDDVSRQSMFVYEFALA